MDEKIRAIVEAERRRNREAEHRTSRRLERARTEAPRIAAELARIDPSVREVWLFGSVATGRLGREQFDIDLDAVSERFREMVYRRGTRLYGKDT